MPPINQGSRGGLVAMGQDPQNDFEASPVLIFDQTFDRTLFFQLFPEAPHHRVQGILGHQIVTTGDLLENEPDREHSSWVI